MSVVQTRLAGRYLLEELIARGGMGEVWRARDEVLERPVAVKLLHETLSGDANAAERFRREALTAASMSHPNMANVFDYVEENGRPGIVMEFVPSHTLADRLTQKQMPISEAIRITRDMLAALEAAHARGIVHRDIKPANILLTPDGEVKVTDFGIARSLSDASLTQTGTVMGTAHYSAPEQVRGETATPATDIYSVGVVLYEMLTGQRPYTGDTPVAVAMARLSEDPPHPRDLRPAIPDELDGVVMRAMAREPSDRFASAAEMRSALDGAGVAALDATQALEVDDTVALPRAPAAMPYQRKREVGAAIPPAWAGKRLAMLLVPLIVIALLAWGLVAAIGGPTTTKVPNFVGLTQAQAEAAASKAHLDLRPQQAFSTKPIGTVIQQDTGVGTTLHSGSTVTVILSKGPPPCCTVPDLTGMTLDQAQSALTSAGLVVGTTSYQGPVPGVHDGTVVGQFPSSSSTLRRGASVALVLSGPPPDQHKPHGKHGEG